MSCICGQSAPFGPLCRRHWAELPSALRVGYTALVREGRPTEAASLVRDYVNAGISLDTLDALTRNAGPNRYRRDQLEDKMKVHENRRREILARFTQPQEVAAA